MEGKPETTPEDAAQALWDRMLGENGDRSPERWKEIVAQAFRERDRRNELKRRPSGVIVRGGEVYGD